MSSAAQRFRKSSPCPICQGYAELPQGQGERCYGFLSADGGYAHCTREEHAGELKPDPNGNTYPHRLIGDCQCGVRHDPTPAYTSSNGHKREVATYDYVDGHGKMIYQTVRYEPKTFLQRRPDGHGGWEWNLKGVAPLIYNLPAVLDAINAKQTICTAEGEEDIKALARHGYTATCNHGGAEKWGKPHSQFLKGAADVVLFGDNDEPGRRHITKQIQSLKTVGIIPRIAQLDGLPEHGDIRDWLKIHTNDDLARVIREAQPATNQEVPLTGDDQHRGDDHQQRWILGAQGKPISCQHNALLWLSDQGYAGHIALDTFKQAITVHSSPLTDDVTIEMVRQMEASTRIRWTETHVHSAMVSLGNRRAHSSLTTWLDSLTWDKKRRLDIFFAKTYGAEYSSYTTLCGEVLFKSAVARAYQPGCQADIVVVLIGGQGIGKSRGIADLVPDPTWYTDDLGGDLYDRKAGEGLQGKWIIEFGEFARINRATSDVVKAFLSRRVDHYRPAYGRTAKDFPRQCVFIGSTNNDQPLQDLENRRFMPVRCYDQIADIAPQREQLWAEAVYRYKAGEPWWVMDKALLSTVKEQQENARQHDEWEEVLRESLKPLTEITLSEAATRLHIPTDRLDKSTTIRLGIVLKAIGFIRKRQSSGDRAWYYAREKIDGTAP